MDQKSPHDVGGEAEERVSIRLVLKSGERLDLQQLEIQLIDQNGRLPRVRRALAPNPARGHLAEFGVERNDQLGSCLLTAAPELFHELLEAA